MGFLWSIEHLKTYGIGGLFAALTLWGVLCLRRRGGDIPRLVGHWWFLFLILAVSEYVSFKISVWLFALLCFWGLREYLSLVEIRLQDRWGMLGAYLIIPFTMYFVHIGWYEMFIIAVPVYGFLLVPLLVSFGKKPEGIIFSIGMLNFGVFLFVYSLGHLIYLARYEEWLAAIVILNVAACDLMNCFGWIQTRPLGVTLAISAVATVGISMACSVAAGIATLHAFVIGVMTPLLVYFGKQVGSLMQLDLGVSAEALKPGQGQLLFSLRSMLYTAPVIFHYLQYFEKLETLLGS